MNVSCRFVCACVFAEDSSRYLKYLGWMLNDRDSSVRLAALDAIVKLLENDSSAPKMTEMVLRFRKRLVEMTGDKDSDVAVRVYTALTLCYK